MFGSFMNVFLVPQLEGDRVVGPKGFGGWNICGKIYPTTGK
jgi:hypothetical protein